MKIFQKSFLAKYSIILVLALGTSPAFSQVSLSIGIAPPPLFAYAQPACPNDGYLWTPGYWAYGDYGYYWVPGTWVQPPQIGVFWTPCYWGWGGSAFVFHSGYWGPNVGFYGGINYGYGYGGNGYGGGRWEGGHFSYNTAVNNVSSTNIHNTYVNSAAISNNSTNVSYNGGDGGVQAKPTAQEQQFAHEQHLQPTAVQQAHAQAASQDRGQLATVNGGRPVTPAAATPESYKHVAQQNVALQPLTQHDAVKAQPVTSAKSGTGASQHIKAEKQTHLASQNTHATKSQETAVKPHDKPVATHQIHPKPLAKAQPHPETHGKPQPQSHPEAHAKPEVHSDKL